MNKGTIWQIIIGILMLIILFMILFVDFWLPLLTDPSIPYSSIAFVILTLIILVVTAGAIVWKKYFSKSNNNTLESRFDARNMKLGLCLGSITNNGTKILERSDYCPFNEPQLHSMLEYSAVCVLHGDIGKIIGPFPMKSHEEMHYISFGFQIPERVNDSENLGNFIQSGGVLGLFLLYYPVRLDSSILLKKKNIINSLKSGINNISHISELLPEKLARIEEEIQFFSLF
ncbi:MAG: hypothetical protein ACXADY_13705 [Candidatus Hodarchaeales archaeon]|jgi:hypothetical protein